VHTDVATFVPTTGAAYPVERTVTDAGNPGIGMGSCTTRETTA
jgi:hypothetical protein